MLLEEEMANLIELVYRKLGKGKFFSKEGTRLPEASEVAYVEVIIIFMVSRLDDLGGQFLPEDLTAGP